MSVRKHKERRYELHVRSVACVLTTFWRRRYVISVQTQGWIMHCLYIGRILFLPRKVGDAVVMFYVAIEGANLIFITPVQFSEEAYE